MKNYCYSVKICYTGRKKDLNRYFEIKEISTFNNFILVKVINCLAPVEISFSITKFDMYIIKCLSEKDYNDLVKYLEQWAGYKEEK